jgi:signal recognition particle GTPase
MFQNNSKFVNMLQSQVLSGLNGGGKTKPVAQLAKSTMSSLSGM